MKIMVHGEINIYFISHFKENNFAKSCFTTTMEITIQISREKKGRSQVTKIPFTTLIKDCQSKITWNQVCVLARHRL